MDVPDLSAAARAGSRGRESSGGHPLARQPLGTTPVMDLRDLLSGATAFDARDLAEDADLERFALERLAAHRVGVGEVGTIYRDEANPRRGAASGVSSGLAESAGGARDELRQSLRPTSSGQAAASGASSTG